MLLEIADDYEKKVVFTEGSTLEYNAHRFCKFDYAWYVGASASYYVQFALMYPVIPPEDREMILQSYYPFDYKSSPIFEITNVLQILMAAPMACANAMMESLLIALVSENKPKVKSSINVFIANYYSLFLFPLQVTQR